MYKIYCKCGKFHLRIIFTHEKCTKTSPVVQTNIGIFSSFYTCYCTTNYVIISYINLHGNPAFSLVYKKVTF